MAASVDDGEQPEARASSNNNMFCLVSVDVFNHHIFPFMGTHDIVNLCACNSWWFSHFKTKCVNWRLHFLNRYLVPHPLAHASFEESKQDTDWYKLCCLMGKHSLHRSTNTTVDAQKQKQKALTFAVLRVVAAPPEDGGGDEDKGCYYIRMGADSQSNAYNGDQSVHASSSILCLKQDGRYQSMPKSLAASRTYSNGWAEGTFKFTPPVVGTSLVSEEACNALIEALFGRGWRIAEFHDGLGGWHYYGRFKPTIPVDDKASASASASASGRLGEEKCKPVVGSGKKADWLCFEAYTQHRDQRRFWVHINDQPANPWGRDKYSNSTARHARRMAFVRPKQKGGHSNSNNNNNNNNNNNMQPLYSQQQQQPQQPFSFFPPTPTNTTPNTDGTGSSMFKSKKKKKHRGRKR